MISLLLIAVGVWIGRSIYGKLYNERLNRDRSRIKLAIEKLIQENMPNLSLEQINNEVNKIIL